MARPLTDNVLDSPALPLLLRLQGDGFNLRANGDRLRVCPSDRVTPDLLDELRRHKPELLILISTVIDAGVQDRVAEYRRQLAAVPARHVPAFLFSANIPYVKGSCFSCGDRLHESRFGRCWRCALAWRLACRLPIDGALAAALDAARVA